jgi:hypothetical protein
VRRPPPTDKYDPNHVPDNAIGHIFAGLAQALDPDARRGGRAGAAGRP